MAVLGFPIDNTGSNTSEEIRQALSLLLGPMPTGRPFGVSSGVRAGTSTSTISISGSTVTVGPHVGVIDAQPSATAGSYFYVITANTNVSPNVTAADATNPRIDSIYVQVNDPAEADGSSTPGVTLNYLAGIPGAASTVRGAAGGPPTLPARSMELGKVAVPKSGSGSPTVTWVAPTQGDSGWVAMTYGSGISSNTVAPAYRVRQGVEVGLRGDFKGTSNFAANAGPFGILAAGSVPAPATAKVLPVVSTGGASGLLLIGTDGSVNYLNGPNVSGAVSLEANYLLG